MMEIFLTLIKTICFSVPGDVFPFPTLATFKFPLDWYYLDEIQSHNLKFILQDVENVILSLH